MNYTLRAGCVFLFLSIAAHNCSSAPAREDAELVAESLRVHARDGRVTISSHGDEGEVTVETLRVARGEAEVGVGSGNGHGHVVVPSVRRDSEQLRLERPESIEEWKLDAHGAEQSWRFRDKPTGDGVLSVSVAIKGARFVHESESGLSFASANGHAWNYSHATWIDAAGVRTAVRALPTETGVRIDVPESLVESSAFPAVLDPTISPSLISLRRCRFRTSGVTPQRQLIATVST